MAYGTSGRVVINQIEAKLHTLLDCMTWPMYVKMFEDPEARGRAVVLDMMIGSNSMHCASPIPNGLA